MNLKPILKTASLFLIALFISSNVQGQAWNTVGSGLTNEIDYQSGYYKYNVSTTDGNTLYVAYIVNDSINISKWDGLAWSTLKNIEYTNYNYNYIYFLEFFQGDLYIQIGSNLRKFDGTSWTTIAPSGFVGYFLDAEIINGELYLVGDFTASGGVTDIVKYDGVSFTAVPNPSAINVIYNIIEYNGELHVSGYNFNVPKTQKLVSGTNWVNIYNYTKNVSPVGSIKLYEYNGKLYGADKMGLFWINSNNFMLFENDTAFYIGDAGGVGADNAVFNGDLYLAGTDSNAVNTLPSLYKFDGTTLSSVAGTPNSITTIDSLNGELIITSVTDSVFNGVKHNYAFRTTANFSLLNGNIYHDNNADCFKNPGEAGIEKVIVSLANQQVSVSDANGHYSISVPAGSYAFGQTIYSPTPGAKNFSTNCTLPNPIIVGVNQTLTQDVGFRNNTPIDLVLTIEAFTGWRARYGFTDTYKISLTNAGNLTVPSANFELMVPSSVTINSIVPAAVSQSGTTYSFTALNINPAETREYLVNAIINTATNSLGDTLSWNVKTVGFVGDADVSDNEMTLEQIVLGAFDPNDKQASDYRILPSTNKIDYHIRFQNTGTDTAYKVVVVDTLDVNLPLTNVMINSTSHPYSLSIVGNVLVWEFDNILLPDSGANFLGSQGYVNFSTGINSGIAVGDTIKNKAEIYFDFQKPIITNQAKTAVVQYISVLEESLDAHVLEVYPNPARDIIHIKNTSLQDLEVQITSTNGQLISNFALKANKVLNYECSNLPAGMYILSTQFESYKILITD